MNRIVRTNKKEEGGVHIMKKIYLLLLSLILLTIITGCATVGEGGSGSPRRPIGRRGSCH